jgi:methylated-DNA-[protein]-cysteine S-methyltransferase
LKPGEVTSYGAIARQLGSPGASRAVGLANGANPIAIVVPCHRVIGANGSLTGYGGGLDRKRWLLNHERRWRNALPLWLTDDLRSPASASVDPNGG